jgi:D-alanine-D-alanine ligase
MRITIVHDCTAESLSVDQQDTLVEVGQAESVLLAAGHRVCRLAFSLDLPVFCRNLEETAPDLVFNLAETVGPGNLAHLVPAICERLGIRCTGGSSRALYLSSDKPVAKRLLDLASIPTPQWAAKGRYGEPGQLVGTAVIVKPVAEEASVGIDDRSVRTFGTEDALRSCLEEGDLFVERFIEGREFSLSLLSDHGRPIVLPPAELQFLHYPQEKPRIAGYEAKWIQSSFAYAHTVRTFSFGPSDRILLDRIEAMGLAVWDLFSASGYARVDFRVDRDGEPWVLELNMNPCISPDSGFVAACEEAGISYDRMIGRIIEE